MILVDGWLLRSHLMLAAPTCRLPSADPGGDGETAHGSVRNDDAADSPGIRPIGRGAADREEKHGIRPRRTLDALHRRAPGRVNTATLLETRSIPRRHGGSQAVTIASVAHSSEPPGGPEILLTRSCDAAPCTRGRAQSQVSVDPFPLSFQDSLVDRRRMSVRRDARLPD